MIKDYYKVAIDYSIVDKWYSGYLPTFKTLLDFSIKSNELTKEVILTPLALDRTAPTAYMDNGQCVLPGLFFVNDFYEKILGIDDYSERIKAAISVINGSQIHESLHHKFLGKEANWLLILDELNINDDNIKNSQVFKDCFNIIEDIYSNYRCSVDYPHIFPFVDLLDRTMFNQHIYDQCYAGVYKNSKQINDVLSMLACHKNYEYDNTINEFTKEYQLHINLLKRARNENLDLQDRYDLAKQLYELLKVNHSVDYSWNDSAGTYVDARKSNSQENHLIVDNIDDLVNIENKFKSKTITANKQDKVQIIFEDVDGYSHRGVKADTKFLGFSRYIKNARAEKQKAQEPRLTGSKILPNRLFTALSDGKIFGRNDTTILEKGNPQLIFLIDWSGSMQNEGLTHVVVSVMLAIFRDLKENGIANAVYAHTTKSNQISWTNVSLIKSVAAYNMPLLNFKQIVTTHDYEQRFSKLYNTVSHQNADGTAIEFVGKRFKSTSGKKALFVLSDGEPSFYDTYSSGVKHTKMSVENLRKSNISVVSLSLVEDVVKTNDEIYGRKHNIRAYGSNLQTNLKKLVSEFVV